MLASPLCSLPDGSRRSIGPTILRLGPEQPIQEVGVALDQARNEDAVAEAVVQRVVAPDRTLIERADFQDNAVPHRDGVASSTAGSMVMIFLALKMVIGPGMVVSLQRGHDQVQQKILKQHDGLAVAQFGTYGLKRVAPRRKRRHHCAKTPDNKFGRRCDDSRWPSPAAIQFAQNSCCAARWWRASPLPAQEPGTPGRAQCRIARARVALGRSPEGRRHRRLQIGRDARSPT